MSTPHSASERDRARMEQVYGKRMDSIPADRYTVFDPGNLFIMQQRERAVVAAILRHGLHPLSGKRVLDVGCGTGGELRNLVRYGAVPDLLSGIDILRERIDRARQLSPNMTFHDGSARALPFPGASFDLVTQFTVFSSVLDGELRSAIALEMLRVLRPGGTILWYDLRRGNPRNPDVLGIGRDDIRALFPRCRYEFRSVTLAPPLARMIAPFSWTTCLALEHLPFLRTHWLAVITKGTGD